MILKHNTWVTVVDLDDNPMPRIGRSKAKLLVRIGQATWIDEGLFQLRLNRVKSIVG